MHTWDLARATGQDERLDPGLCAELLAGMEPMEDVIRSSGQYGPKVEVPDDADPQTKLLGFIGRDRSLLGSPPTIVAGELSAAVEPSSVALSGPIRTLRVTGDEPVRELSADMSRTVDGGR